MHAENTGGRSVFVPVVHDMILPTGAFSVQRKPCFFRCLLGGGGGAWGGRGGAITFGLCMWKAKRIPEKFPPFDEVCSSLWREVIGFRIWGLPALVFWGSRLRGFQGLLDFVQAFRVPTKQKRNLGLRFVK